jgi:hypothetical protein
MANLSKTERDQLRAELNRIDDSLCDPVLEGREWDERRAALERRREHIANLLAGR